MRILPPFKRFLRIMSCKMQLMSCYSRIIHRCRYFRVAPMGGMCVGRCARLKWYQPAVRPSVCVPSPWKAMGQGQCQTTPLQTSHYVQRCEQDLIGALSSGTHCYEIVTSKVIQPDSQNLWVYPEEKLRIETMRASAVRTWQKQMNADKGREGVKKSENSADVVSVW